MVKLEDRERKMLALCIEYSLDPFGAPNHLLMVLVAKMYEMLRDFGLDLLA